MKKEEKEKKKKRKETVKIGNVQKKMQDLILKLEMADKKGTVVTQVNYDDTSLVIANQILNQIQIKL